MLHHIQYVDEKLRELERTGVNGNPTSQEPKQRFVMDFHCECCREWRADTRARRSIVRGARYLFNLCTACALPHTDVGHRFPPSNPVDRKANLGSPQVEFS